MVRGFFSECTQEVCCSIRAREVQTKNDPDFENSKTRQNRKRRGKKKKREQLNAPCWVNKDADIGDNGAPVYLVLSTEPLQKLPTSMCLFS